MQLLLEGNSVKEKNPRIIFNTTTDVCLYLKQKDGSNFFMKIVYDILSQHGKFAQKCPIDKDTPYYFDDFKITEDVVPSYVPLRESYAIFSMTYFTLDKKKMVPIVVVKVFVQLHIE